MHQNRPSTAPVRSNSSPLRSSALSTLLDVSKRVGYLKQGKIKHQDSFVFVDGTKSGLSLERPVSKHRRRKEREDSKVVIIARKYKIIPLDATKRINFLRGGHRIPHKDTFAFIENGNEQLSSSAKTGVSKQLFSIEEYVEMSSYDMIICVEHCCNCTQHNLTTRHCEAKYVEYANLILHSISDFILEYNLNVRVGILRLPIQSIDRIGALEITLYYQTITKEIMNQIIYSKLLSNTWPSVTAIQNTVIHCLKNWDILLRNRDLDSSICTADVTIPSATLKTTTRNNMNNNNNNNSVIRHIDSSVCDTETNTLTFKWVNDARQWHPSKVKFEVCFFIKVRP